MTGFLRWLWSTPWGRRWMEQYGTFTPPVARVYDREWAYHRRVRQLRPFLADPIEMVSHGIDP